MNKIFRILPALAATVIFALIAIACGPSIDVATEYDPEASFATVRSYNWASPADSESTTGLLTDNPRSDARVRQAVDEHLADSGYVIDAENPDFLIGYNALIQGRVTAQTIADNYSYGSGWGYTYYGLNYTTDVASRSVTTYEEGTLIIDILNPETRALMWRGIARAELDPERSNDDRRKIVERAVEELFSYFPPQ